MGIMVESVMTENTNAAVSPPLMLSRETLILLLSIVGAGVDAVMLMVFGVLTAAQTGNTILFGVALGQGQWQTGLAAGISVIGFVVGSGVGELIVEGGRARRAGPPLVAGTLVVELVLLALVLVAWRLIGADPAPRYQNVLIALAACAMGIQSTVTLRLHAGPMTTYMTGTLTTFTTGLIRSLRWGGLDPSQTSTQQERPWMYGVTWAAYLAGAVVTAVLCVQWREAALLLPIAVLGIVVAAASVRR